MQGHSASRPWLITNANAVCRAKRQCRVRMRTRAKCSIERRGALRHCASGEPSQCPCSGHLPPWLQARSNRSARLGRPLSAQRSSGRTYSAQRVGCGRRLSGKLFLVSFFLVTKRMKGQMLRCGTIAQDSEWECEWERSAIAGVRLERGTTIEPASHFHTRNSTLHTITVLLLRLDTK